MAKKNHYLTNKNLKAELVKCHEKKQLTNEACKMFYLLIEKIQSTVFYKDLNAKEDCASHAMYIIVKNWHKFDMTLGNPFSFFTTTVANALKQGWNMNEQRPIHISLNAFINNDAETAE